MRVLHLIDAARRLTRRPGPAGWSLDDALAACSLAASIPAHHTLLLLGGPDAARRAHNAGLHHIARISPPLGLASLARPQFRGTFDLVHAWDAASAPLGPRFWPRARHLAWVADDPPAIVRPRDPLRRAALRARWRLRDDHRAVLLLGPRPDGMRLAYLAGVAERVGPPVAGILPADSTGIARGAAFHRGARSQSPIIASTRPRHELMEACDIGLIDSLPNLRDPLRAHDVRPWIAAAHAAGLPVVCPAALAGPDLYPPSATPLLATNSAMQHIGGRLAEAAALDLDALSDSVRAHIAGLDLASRFIDAVRLAWGLAPASQVPQVKLGATTTAPLSLGAA